MRKDLIVIVFLGLLVLLGTAGLIVLAAKGRATDPALVGIVTGALGALSSILVQTKDDAPAAKVPPLPILAMCFVLAGCAGTFEEARLAGLKAHPASAAAEHRDDARCKELDDARISAGANAKGLGVVAGVAGAGGGISEAVIGAPRWVAIGAALASVAAGAGALHQLVTAEGKGAAWARECSGGTP